MGSHYEIAGSNPAWPPAHYKQQEAVGHKCRVRARGKMNSILVEFLDGYKVITSRYAVRQFKEEKQWQ